MPLASVLLAVSLTAAQTPGELPRSRGRDSTFYVDGEITDAAGQPVPRARLLLNLFGNQAQRSLFSDLDGRFIFQGLTEGTYSLDITAAGYQSHHENVTLISASRHLRIVLTPQDLPDTPPAAGELPVVSTALLKVPRKAESLFHKGVQAHKRRDYAAAHRCFDRAIAVHPGFAAAYAAHGVAYLQERQIARAESAFQKALEADPDTFDAQLGLGLVRNDQRRFEEAAGHLREALSLNPQPWQVHYELGRAHFGLRRYAEAEVCLKQARRSRPAHARLYLLLAQVLLAQDKLLEAAPEMEMFLKIVPTGPTADKVREALRRIREREAQGGSDRTPTRN
jgi:tetratricopeptide (TPR) repeat protein